MLKSGTHRSQAVEAATGRTDIFVVNADGTDLQNLTNTRDVNEEHLTWSPDGRKLAFEENGHDTWKVNADGSDPTYVGVGWSPAWSPDGTNIAFTVANNGDWDIDIMSPDGTNRQFLVELGHDDRPAWSPHGREIAFDNSKALNDQIVVSNADGTNTKNLTNDSVNTISPSWQKAMPLPIAAPPPVKPVGPPLAAPPPWSAQPGR